MTSSTIVVRWTARVRRRRLHCVLLLFALGLSAAGREGVAFAAQTTQRQADSSPVPASGSAEARRAEVQSHLSNHQEAKALDAARRAIAFFPDDPGVKALHCKALLRNGRYTEGLTVAAEMTESDRARYDLERSIRAGEVVIEGDSHTKVAAGARAVPELETAAGFYERAAAIDPDNVAIRRALAWFYLERLDRVDRATHHLAAVLRATPDDVSVRKLLAIAYARSGRLAAAIRLFREVLEQDPVDRWMLINLARALAASGVVSEAEQIYQRLLLNNPDDLQAQLGRIELLAWQAQTDQAVDAARALLASSPSPPVHSLLGDIFRWNWQVEPARQAYEAALVLDGDFAPARDGVRDLRRLRAPTADPRAFRFNDSDHFQRTMSGVSVRIPAAERGFVKVDLEQWWFRVPNAISIARLDSGAGFEYHWTQAFETLAGATVRRSSAGTQTSVNASAKWSPSRAGAVYLSHSHEIPVADSIATIRSALTQNVSGAGLDLGITNGVSVQLGLSLASYADGNFRREALAQASWRFFDAGAVVARGQYNYLAFAERRSSYFAPAKFEIARGVFEAEPRLGEHLALTLKAELPYVITERRFGHGFTAGVKLPEPHRVRGDLVYFRHRVPGGATIWSGDGVRANFTLSF